MPTSLYDAKYQQLRESLIATRKEAGLTQVQMAKKLAVGQSYISKIEQGESYIDVMLWANWCLACSAAPGAMLDNVLNQ